MSTVPEPTAARQSSNELAGLLRCDREATANFVIALATFDRDRHWVQLGYNCLFNYVHRELRMSRSAAFFRTKAAELIQRFPEVAEPLRDGRLCMTAVVQLAKVMNESNRADILPRFFNQSNQAAKEIVAELAPVLNPPRREVVTALSTITHPRALRLAPTAAPPPSEGTPDGAVGQGGTAPQPLSGCSASTDSRHELERGHDFHLGALGETISGQPDAADVVALVPAASNDQDAATHSAAVNGTTPMAPASPLDSWMEPLTADLFRLHVTVTREFLRKLAAARDALAHFRTRRSAASGPSLIGRNAEAIEEGLDLILARDARNKGLTVKPRKEPRLSAFDHVPAHVKRAVGERDHWQCQYPLESGGICGSRRNVQIDHIDPKSKGGEAVVENLRVLCAHHNAVAARLALGDEVMDRYTRRGRTR